MRGYLCDESILSFRFVGQQTAEHMDLFPVQTSSCTLPLGESKRKWGGGCMVSQYSTSAQDTITPLHAEKSKGLSVGSFSWAPFQVCLGPLPGVGSEV